MAKFDPAFEKMILNEGGYKLHEVKGDRGGLTYAGIAQNFHPKWTGWGIINLRDMNNPDLTSHVFEFYKEKFWDRIKGDEIESQEMAATIFDFAVNAGVRTASKLAQIIVSAAPDGIIGEISVQLLNDVRSENNDELFIVEYALAKIARYAEICKRDPVQKKFLLGWINRTIRGLKV